MPTNIRQATDAARPPASRWPFAPAVVPRRHKARRACRTKHGILEIRAEPVLSPHAPVVQESLPFKLQVSSLTLPPPPNRTYPNPNEPVRTKFAPPWLASMEGGMVLRTGRREANVDEGFWGCITHPQCRRTRTLSSSKYGRPGQRNAELYV